MKTFTFLKMQLLILMIGTAFVQGQQLYSAETFYNTTPVQSSVINFNYDQSGKLVNEQAFDIYDEIYFEYIYSYNSNQAISSITLLNYNNNSSENYERGRFIYDESGKVTIYYQDLATGSGQDDWVTIWRYNYSYDSDGNLTGFLRYYYDEFLDSYELTDRITCNYVNNSLNGYLWESFSDGSYYNKRKKIFNRDSEGRVVEILTYEWTYNDSDGYYWEHEYRYVYSFDSNSNMITRMKYYGDGDLAYSIEYTYDTNEWMEDTNNPFSITRFEAENNLRHPYYYLGEEYPFKNKILRESKYYPFDDDLFTTIYSYRTELNVNEINLSSSQFKLYPNPCKNFIYLLGLKKEEKYHIINSNGKVVKNGLIKNKEIIKVNQLPIGVYFVKLDSGQTIKFIKE